MQAATDELVAIDRHFKNQNPLAAIVSDETLLLQALQQLLYGRVMRLAAAGVKLVGDLPPRRLAALQRTWSIASSVSLTLAAEGRAIDDLLDSVPRIMVRQSA